MHRQPDPRTRVHAHAEVTCVSAGVDPRASVLIVKEDGLIWATNRPTNRPTDGPYYTNRPDTCYRQVGFLAQAISYCNPDARPHPLQGCGPLTDTMRSHISVDFRAKELAALTPPSGGVTGESGA